jgi:hypothetical protein
MDWQPGYDWEVATQPDGSYIATLYDRTTAVAMLSGWIYPWLRVRMAWTKWRKTR